MKALNNFGPGLVQKKITVYYHMILYLHSQCIILALEKLKEIINKILGI